MVRATARVADESGISLARQCDPQVAAVLLRVETHARAMKRFSFLCEHALARDRMISRRHAHPCRTVPPGNDQRPAGKYKSLFARNFSRNFNEK